MNKVVGASAKTMAVFAFIHLILLLVYAIIIKDYAVMNIFNILDLDFIYPNLAKGVLLFILSYIPVIVIFSYFYSKEKKSH